MKETEAIITYLHKTLSLELKVLSWKGESSLPIYLRHLFHFYESSILGIRCLFAIAQTPTEITPAVLQKHIKEIQKIWGGLCVYGSSYISSYNRKRLIEKHIPFIIPGNQMYLPDLGIDLREHFKKTVRVSIQSLSPATQAIIIHALLDKSNACFNPSKLGKMLHYTLMTMSRSFDEIEIANIGSIYRKGKERKWHFEGSRSELWQQAKPFLRSPIKYRRWILQTRKPLVSAGVSALSQLSMINTPYQPVYAVSVDQWKSMKLSGIEEIPSPEEAAMELEVWSYDPNLFSRKGIVDPFSLYLSLEKVSEERIEVAIDEMMKKVEW